MWFKVNRDNIVWRIKHVGWSWKWNLLHFVPSPALRSVRSISFDTILSSILHLCDLNNASPSCFIMEILGLNLLGHDWNVPFLTPHLWFLRWILGFVFGCTLETSRISIVLLFGWCSFLFLLNNKSLLLRNEWNVSLSLCCRILETLSPWCPLWFAVRWQCLCLWFDDFFLEIEVNALTGVSLIAPL